MITIDLYGLLAELHGPPWVVTWKLFLKGGWVVVTVMAIIALAYGWMQYRQDKYRSKWRYILLAIDIPKNNEQTPLAVEHIFSHLAGAEDKPTLWEKYYEGKVQEDFSLELISVEGRIQFIVRTTSHFKDMVESAVYAQYPDAEITEVDDYTEVEPAILPSEKHDIWGTEFRLYNNEVYPIRVYKEFEHELSQKLVDPMAALLETLNTVGSGEQVWLQWVITPVRGGWAKAGQVVTDKIMGRDSSGGGMLSSAWQEIKRWFDEVMSQLFGSPTSGPEAAPIKDGTPNLLRLSPGEKDALEALQRKTSKIGFKTKFRLVYVAEKESYDVLRGAISVIGAILQFATQDRNGFVLATKTKTSTHYFWTKSRLLARKRRLLRNYRLRSTERGWGKGFILNIEELATVWHFPMFEVKVPLVQTIESKRGEPPPTVPFQSGETSFPEGGLVGEAGGDLKPPNNLPVV